MKGMIFAAGLGTRFKPWTDHHPKALAFVNGKTLLQRNVEFFQKYNIKDIIVNVHHFADQVRKAINDNKGWGSNISISDETNALLETGGGLINAGWFFDNGPFIVINADILTDMDLGEMISFHNQNNAVATLATTERKTSRYFLFDENQDLCGWENFKTGEKKISKQKQQLFPRAFSGIHIISPEIFSLIKQEGKFSIVDVYLEICKTKTIKSFDHSGSKFVDVGRTESLTEAQKLFL